jgi:apoptogenic protein 1
LIFSPVSESRPRSRRYWSQTNTRFEAAKAAAVNDLPSHATAEQREDCLGEFYKHWVLQETTRQREYDSEWRRRSMEEIKLAARVSYQKFKARLGFAS